MGELPLTLAELLERDPSTLEDHDNIIRTSLLVGIARQEMGELKGEVRGLREEFVAHQREHGTSFRWVLTTGLAALAVVLSVAVALSR